MQHRDFRHSPKLGVATFASRMLGVLAFGAALLSAAAVHAAPVSELPTKWQVPPGDRLEYETAGFAKILCSAIFITGRDLKTAADEDGFFISPPASRAKVVNTVVDRDEQGGPADPGERGHAECPRRW